MSSLMSCAYVVNMHIPRSEVTVQTVRSFVCIRWARREETATERTERSDNFEA